MSCPGMYVISLASFDPDEGKTIKEVVYFHQK